MANVYALLVGINDYPFKPLQGCINDVNAVLEFLTSKFSTTNLCIKTLTDNNLSKPSRPNIIDAFSVFDNAKDGDCCLFYYSGHGSFSYAPKEFQTDNGFVQSFVCHDSRQPGGKDLMDKEMSFLIWKSVINRPNVTFVAITDCCHSGTITRALDDSGITDRMASGDAEHVPSKPEDYFGYGITVKNEISNEDEKAFEESIFGNTRIIKVKQGKHIHLAASRDNQTSKELIIDGVTRGAFTYSLINILHNYGGQISYKDLIDQTSVLVRNLVPDQEPDLNMNGGLTSAEKGKIFLSQESSVSSHKFLVYYDSKYSWCLKGGLLHGISKGDKIVIDNVCTSIIIGSPSPDFSVIISKPELGTSDKTYYAKVLRQPNQALKISCAQDVPLEIKKLILETQTLMPSSFVSFLLEGSGQYIVRTNYLNETFITLPGSNAPIFRPLQIFDSNSAKYFLERVEIVSKWIHLMEFNNPASELNSEHYRIKLFKSISAGNYDPATFEEVRELYPLNELFYTKNEDEWYQPAFRLSVTNTTSFSLWVTNAYLGFDYGIYTDFFSTMEVGPGKEVWINFIRGNLPVDVIKMMIDKKYQDLGYDEIKEYIKLFISTQKIDTHNLSQDAVDLPTTRDIKTKDFTLRIPGEENNNKTTLKVAWKTETIGFKIIKPHSNIHIAP